MRYTIKVEGPDDLSDLRSWCPDCGATLECPVDNTWIDSGQIDEFQCPDC